MKDLLSIFHFQKNQFDKQLEYRMNKEEEILSIAVCDDDQDTCDLIKLIGEQQGYNVYPCLTPGEFKNKSEKHDIHVIFMDINWGVADGVKMASELKADYKVYALSGAHNISQIAEEQELDGFIEKPFSLKDLRELLNNLAEDL
ncbi:response regulator [Fulvivirga maritima]|uniref:response regulator n=1 Tax=Fulvivirga maritima TaxID=2904247 RepID=UPI001F272CC0|nr:response regulator [Fulvivirga maritima]UII26273.1 response regulator [Fulvivirga maritima]